MPRLAMRSLSFAVVLWAGTCCSFARGSPDSLPVVEKIRLADLAGLLRQDSGRVILVNAWATWCKSCKDEMPRLLKLRRAYQGKPFRLILISADDVDKIRTKVRPALRKFGVDFPSYLMNESTDDVFISGMSPEWNGALPATFLYDRTGKPAGMMVGEKSYRQFEDAVKKLLGK